MLKRMLTYLVMLVLLASPVWANIQTWDFETGAFPMAGQYPNQFPNTVLLEGAPHLHFGRLTAVPADCGASFNTTCPRTRSEAQIFSPLPDVAGATRTFKFDMRIPSSGAAGNNTGSHSAMYFQPFEGLNDAGSARNTWILHYQGHLWYVNQAAPVPTSSFNKTFTDGWGGNLPTQAIDLGAVVFDQWNTYQMTIKLATDTSGTVNVKVNGVDFGTMTNQPTTATIDTTTFFINVVDAVGNLGIVDFDNLSQNDGQGAGGLCTGCYFDEGFEPSGGWPVNGPLVDGTTYNVAGTGGSGWVYQANTSTGVCVPNPSGDSIGATLTQTANAYTADGGTQSMTNVRCGDNGGGSQLTVYPGGTPNTPNPVRTVFGRQKFAISSGFSAGSNGLAKIWLAHSDAGASDVVLQVGGTGGVGCGSGSGTCPNYILSIFTTVLQHHLVTTTVPSVAPNYDVVEWQITQNSANNSDAILALWINGSSVQWFYTDTFPARSVPNPFTQQAFWAPNPGGTYNFQFFNTSGNGTLYSDRVALGTQRIFDVGSGSPPPPAPTNVRVR